MNLRLFLCCAAFYAGSIAWGVADAPWSTTLDAADFKDCSLIDPKGGPDDALPLKIKQDHALHGQGWVDYAFKVPRTGWYEVLLANHAGVIDHDFFIDHNLHVYGGITGKITNAWLTEGSHTLRIQELTYPGLSGNIKGVVVRQSGATLASTVRVAVLGDSMVFRKGEKIRLEISSGTVGGTLTISTRDAKTDETVATQTVTLAPTPGLVKKDIEVPCTAEGIYYLSFGDGSTPIAPTDLREIQFCVIDTSPAPMAEGGEIKKTLVREIDCAATPPAGGFYAHGETKVVNAPFGSYRESGPNGYMQDPTSYNFFAYNIDVPEAQKPYLIEVDYPDDAYRTFCIGPIGLEGIYKMNYLVGGVDSGGEFSLSHTMQTQTFIYWARDKDLRLLALNAQSGGRAALSKIRVYRIDGPLPALNISVKNGRSFGYWMEQGDQWVDLNGGMDKSIGSYYQSTRRWAEASRYMGANILMPTVVIYQATLYPTKFYDGYFRIVGGPRDPMTLDVVRILMLCGEKYGLKILPEFHPTWNGYKRKADDAVYAKDPDPKPELLVSKYGMTGIATRPSRQPYYNPLYPANRDWYVGMLGEFADRYKDSPAFAGVSLRIMNWVGESFNWLPSLDWGYGDYTIHLFERQTGIRIPVADDDKQRFIKRYNWLMAHAREDWIQWRCEKIAGLYRAIADRLHQDNPNLLVVAAFHGPRIDEAAFPANELDRKIARDGWLETLREDGFDPDLLSQIDGFCFLNAFHSYGRRMLNDLAEQGNRDMLLDPKAMTALVGKDGRVGIQFNNSYFEANRYVVPAQFGLEKAPTDGFVGAANPAGRHYLERYALALADADASLIIDGGLGYIQGQSQYLHEFLSEYRELPVARFTPRPDGLDPVAVWELKREDAYYFYAVNRERFPVQVDLRLSGGGTLLRLSTGEAAPVKDGSLRLDLLPYQLMAFKGPASLAISRVKETVPEEDLKKVTAMVNWLSQLADDATRKKPGLEDLGSSLATLQQDAREARECLAQGHVWRARTLMENEQLLAVYHEVFRFPPYLRDLKAPLIPATATQPADPLHPYATAQEDRIRPPTLLPADLQKVAHSSDGRAVEIWPSASVSPTWVGDSLLGATSPELDLTVPIPVLSRYHFSLGYVSGGDYGPLNLSVGGQAVGTATDERPDPHGAEAYSSGIILQPGTQTLRLERTSGTKTAISFLTVDPAYHDILENDWSVAGPFPSLDNISLPGDGFDTAFPPEQKRDFSADIPLGNGTTGRWDTLEGDSDYVNIYAHSHNLGQGINYAVTYVYSPTGRKARLSYGSDFWCKVWVNGALVRDESTGVFPSQKGVIKDDVDLKQGWNEILIKIQGGNAGNGFFMAISDPGDLKFAPRPPEAR